MKNPFSRKPPIVPIDPTHITAENAFMYSPDVAQPGSKGRFKRFWHARSKPQQVLLIAGVVTIIFSSLMIGLSFTVGNSGSKSSQSTVASNQSSDGSSSSSGNSDGTDSAAPSDDLNQNGIVDEYEVDTASSEDVSWWQSLLNKMYGKTDTSSEGNSSSDVTTDGENDISLEGEGDENTDNVLQDTEDQTYVTTPPTINTSTTLSLTIGSWNVYKNNKVSNIVGGLKNLLQDVDILGIQEGGTHAATIHDTIACATCAYAEYPSASNTPRKVAIFWRKAKFTALKSGYRYGSTQDGVKKYFVWVKFKENTSGKIFYAINTHFPFNSTGVNKLLNTSGGRAYKDHMPALLKLLKELEKDSVPIFITGDFNADYRTDKGGSSFMPRVALSKGMNVKSGWEYLNLKGLSSSTGTASSSRIIDYVFSWSQSYVSYQSMNIIRAGSSRNGWSGSDHKPVALKLIIGKTSN